MTAGLTRQSRPLHNPKESETLNEKLAAIGRYR